MTLATVLLLGLASAIAMFALARRRALASVKRRSRLNSLPAYYGAYCAIWTLVPLLIVAAFWVLVADPLIELSLERALSPSVLAGVSGDVPLILNEVRNLAAGVVVTDREELNLLAADFLALEAASRGWLAVLALTAAALGALFSFRRVRPDFAARMRVERFARQVLVLASGVAVATTIGIVLSILFEALRFFARVPLTEFLFGIEWSPQTAIRSDQVGSSGAFGAVPLFLGTAMVSLIALTIAVPMGVMSAVYLSEYASPRFRQVARPALDVLAGIPTVVYGFIAALFVAPMVGNIGARLGLAASSESALAAGLVLGVMIIPLISSLTDDALRAVPGRIRQGALALGATQVEMIVRVLVPAASPGIFGGVLLAVSRAIGETMIAIMAAGLVARLTVNPLEPVTTVTVQIVTLLVGDQDSESVRTLSAYALGLLLFAVTFGLNALGLRAVRSYRAQYV